MRIAVAGDWHGNAGWAEKAIDHAAESNATFIVHVGDFGYWVNSKNTRSYLGRVNARLAQYNVTLSFIDGNHEDHSRLTEWNVVGGGAVQLPDHPKISYLPRGYRWELGGKTFMAVGGAHSIDRHRRTPMVDWWPEEYINVEQEEYASRDGDVDVVFSHDCPDGVDIPGIEPPGLSRVWPVGDQFISHEHRKVLGRIVDATKPKVLMHGHYHVGYRSNRGDCLVIGLEPDGGVMHRHMTFIDL